MNGVPSSRRSVPRDEPALVRVRAVDVMIAGQPVLHDLDWALHRGEHWAVVGPNGSGKTSFLRLISGTLWPAPRRGTRHYDFGGGTQTDAVQALGKITLVGHEPQDHYVRLGWNFTAAEVVLTGIFRTNIPRRAASSTEADRARELLNALHLSHLGERRFLELSRGEQRRVLIARALAFEPEILLLDEPAAGLDRRAREALNRTIDEISAQMTLVYSSHQVLSLPRSTTRMLRIEAGRITETRLETEGATERSPVSSAARPPARANRDAKSSAVLIEIDNANVWLGERRVLGDLTWRLQEGQHWLIAGPNGAGKSTFLRLLHGQLRPALGGSIQWAGLGDPRNVWALRRVVGWVSPELQAGYRHAATVRDCVASGLDSSLGLVRRLRAEEQDLVSRALEALELVDLAGRSIRTLSYGQFRRTLIARALVSRPRVLLLDEPWEGLDPHAMAVMSRELEGIAERGTQLVCASHLDTFQNWFTHRLELEGGHAVAVSKIRD